METKNNNKETMRSVDSFIAKYTQQEQTANQCGYECYAEMSVMHWINEYTALATVAQMFPLATRIAMY